MGSIPLVALNVKPIDPLQQGTQAMELRNLGQQTQQQAALAPGQVQQQQQQLQLGQQAIQQGQFSVQDREAGMKAMQQWDGKSQDEIPDLIQKNGGSLDSVLKARKSVIEAQQAKLALNDAQLANTKIKTDYLLGKLQAASGTDVPDDQLGQSVMNAAQESIKAGYLDPEHAQQLQQFIQQYSDPKELRSHLAIYEKGLKADSTQNAQLQKDREDAVKQQEANSKDWKDFPAMGIALNTRTGEVKTPAGQTMTPEQMSSKYVAIQQKQRLGQAITPEDKAFMGAYSQFKALVPTATFNMQNNTPGGPTAPLSDSVIEALAAPGAKLKLSDVLPPRAPESVRQAALNQILAKHPEYASSNYDVEKKAAEKYTSGNVSDQLLAINTAREHIKTFSALADALDNGNVQKLNKLGNEIGVQFGSDKASNLRIAAQALGGEMGKAFDGAGAVAGEREKWQSDLADYLSKGQFAGAVKTADSLLAGKQKSAREGYAASQNAKPNFGDEKTGAPKVKVGDTVKLKNGKSITVKEVHPDGSFD